MTAKSHVGLGFNVCPLCQKRSEVVLLDKRLRDTIPSGDNFLGYALCDEHAAMSDEYIGFAEMTAPFGTPGAEFTGRYVHIRRTVAAQLFRGVDLAGRDWAAMECGVLDQLAAMQTPQPAPAAPAVDEERPVGEGE